MFAHRRGCFCNMDVWFDPGRVGFLRSFIHTIGPNCIHAHLHFTKRRRRRRCLEKRAVLFTYVGFCRFSHTMYFLYIEFKDCETQRVSEAGPSADLILSLDARLVANYLRDLDAEVM